MASRRDFLKAAATGALALGAQSKLGLAAAADQQAGKSKVVIARDPALHGPDARLDAKRAADLLDRAITAYTDRNHPVEAWKQIVPKAKVIGLKVNGVGNKGVSTHLELVLALCERLQQAGVRAGDILVWDRSNEALESAGFTINTDPSRIRCYGNDTAGFEEQPTIQGSVKVNLTKILTRECDLVINMPILKDHDLVGCTFSLKNMYGAIERPAELHANNCDPALADLCSIPVVRQKVRFTVGDAISSVYEKGPVFHPEYLWHPNALIVGADAVAVDHTAAQMLARKRAEVGLPPVEAVGRPARYLATAADQAHRLGVNDPRRINLLEV
jgi:uncharacterized protein (DUF362 family)